MTTPKEQTQIDYVQHEIANSTLICKDMLEHSASKYVYLTKELTNAMLGWYNIKPEDTKND